MKLLILSHRGKESLKVLDRLLFGGRAMLHSRLRNPIAGSPGSQDPLDYIQFLTPPSLAWCVSELEIIREGPLIRGVDGKVWPKRQAPINNRQR